MAMMQSITFGGVNSADYGIYIGGEGTFNAPQRDVEMISIPGRDGAFALDKGRFENIEVKYTVINQEPDLATFSANLESFRNALCSQRGYQRLEDTFHPDEYRMAVFADKFEVEPIEYNTASKFDIVFDCKPQRFLTSGENGQVMSDGGTIHNPTLFESSPLIEVEGGGVVTIGDFDIILNDEEVGEITLLPSGSKNRVVSRTEQRGALTELFEAIPFALVDDGDTITLPSFKVDIAFGVASNQTLDSLSIVFVNHGIPNFLSASTVERIDERTMGRSYSYGTQTWTKGVASSAEDTLKATYQITTTDAGGTSTTETVEVTFKLRLAFATTGSIQIVGYDFPKKVNKGLTIAYDAVTAVSTQSVLGNPTYIDCDLGEAYKEIDGNVISLNRYIDLGSQLPKLSVGDTEIGYEDTITGVTIFPHWWKV